MPGSCQCSHEPHCLRVSWSWNPASRIGAHAAHSPWCHPWDGDCHHLFMPTEKKKKENLDSNFFRLNLLQVCLCIYYRGSNLVDQNLETVSRQKHQVNHSDRDSQVSHTFTTVPLTSRHELSDWNKVQTHSLAEFSQFPDRNHDLYWKIVK